MEQSSRPYSKIPWAGGLNDSVDPGMLPDGDLVTADNVVFGTSGSRLKRPGFEYFDSASEIPAVTHRSSSGTTRSLVFASTLLATSPDIHKLVVGERIVVSGGPAAYNGTFTITAITTTNVTDDTLTYTAVGSLTEGSTATSAISVDRADPYISITDFWYYQTASNEKVNEVITVQNNPDTLLFFKFDQSGRRTQIVPGTPGSDDDFSAADTMQVCTAAMNEKLIFAFDGRGNLPRVYDPNNAADEYTLLPGSPPDFSVAKVYLGRLVTNDKNNRDRLQYSPPGDTDTWNGLGDSGAIDIYPGDGDARGLAGHDVFKGRLFMWKKGRFYQLVGDSPETFRPEPVSTGVGLESPLSIVAIDQDDLVFQSDKGFHSVEATAAYGDFAGGYLSKKIQNRFNTFNSGRLRYTQGTYIPTLNSIAFAVAEEGMDEQSAILLFNTELKEWYRWPNVDAQCLTRKDSESAPKRLMWGTSNSRIVLAQRNTYTDFDDTPTVYRIKSGTVYPDGDPLAVKAFKKLTLYYKPKGNFSFNVRIKIDNFPVQTLVFNQVVSADELGVDFVLGQSLLAYEDLMAPYTQEIDGYGRGLSIEIEQSGVEQQVEIYGYTIWFESGGLASETLSSADN